MGAGGGACLKTREMMTPIAMLCPSPAPRHRPAEGEEGGGGENGREGGTCRRHGARLNKVKTGQLLRSMTTRVLSSVAARPACLQPLLSRRWLATFLRKRRQPACLQPLCLKNRESRTLQPVYSLFAPTLFPPSPSRPAALVLTRMLASDRPPRPDPGALTGGRPGGLRGRGNHVPAIAEWPARVLI